MINKDYLISQLGFTASDNSLSAALIDAGIDGTQDYVASNGNTLKQAAIGILELILSTPDSTSGAGETQNSIKYDRAAVLNRIKILETALGLTDAIPTITGLKCW